MRSDGPAASPASPTDAGRIARKVHEALAPRLADATEPLDIDVKVRHGSIEVHVRAAGALGPGRTDWSFAEWFRDQIRSRRLSQEAAARRFGVSVKTVNRWARGDTEPRFRELVMIYQALGESPFASPESPGSEPVPVHVLS